MSCVIDAGNLTASCTSGAYVFGTGLFLPSCAYVGSSTNIDCVRESSSIVLVMLLCIVVTGGLGHSLRSVNVLELAVLLESRQLVGVNHGEHLRETLTHASNSLGRVSEGQLAPRHKFNLFTVQVNQVLLARSTGETTERLLREHGFLLVIITAFAHEEIVEVLKLALKQFKSLLGLSFVCELLG